MIFKLIAGAVTYAATATAVVLQQTNGGTALPVTWLVGIFVTILIAVFTAMGAVLWKTYAMTKQWDAILEGREGVDGSDGFIGRSEQRHKQLSDSHEQLYEQMLVQGQLLSELSYAFSDIAEELEDADDINVDVNLNRIHNLRKRKENQRDSDE